MTVPIQEPSPVEKRLAGAFVKTFLVPRFKGKPWSLPGHLDAVSTTFRGNGGARIAATHVRHQDPHGIVVLAHPYRRYGQHWFARSGWLDLLQDGGYDALTFDFPRFGRTQGGATYYHEDVLAAVRHAGRLRPGIPVHVVGVSIGAFAAVNASPLFQGVESLLLESPYPSFASWYQANARPSIQRLGNAAFNRFFPTTLRRIDALRNVRHAAAKRILVTATRDDEVTPVGLTRSVAVRAPADRTTYLELSGVPHLGLIERPHYRAAILDHLSGRPVQGQDPARLAASAAVPVGAPPPALKLQPLVQAN